MSNAADIYLTANTALNQKRTELEGIIKTMRYLADTLNSGQGCWIEGEPTSLNISDSLQKISGNWPTAKRYHEALTLWFEAKEQADAAWHLVPEEERLTLRCPDLNFPS